MSSLLVIGIMLSLSAFVLYNMLLAVLPVSDPAYHGHIERSEHYIYSAHNFKRVFVGSGLIGGLNTALMPPFVNLFFPYFGAATGVEILTRSGKPPQTVFIEINYIFKGIDQDLTRHLFDNRLSGIKSILPSLQRKNRPNLLIKSLLNKTRKNQTTRYTEQNEQKNHQALEMFTQLYDKLPEHWPFQQTVSHLKANIDSLTAQGCQVVFFEIPMDSLLMEAKLFRYQRNVLRQTFKESRFRWLRYDEDFIYQTYDGIHLTAESMDYFAKTISEQIKKII